jgi:outer membrane protein TolC
VETDPRNGVQAALSEFDAQVASSVVYQHNDRALNNVFLGGGTRLFKQRTSAIQTDLSKRTAIGGEFFLRNNLGYDHNNAPGNLFENYWDVSFEAGFRQSLLQGAGVDFNRIAGPSGEPGVYQGVLIARANADISAADFELAVRNFVSDVENAYWDLYFAYRDLDAKKFARDAALETWQYVESRRAQGQRGGEAYQEAQAREQYFRFQEDVQNALTGRLLDATRTYNGSPEGTLRATGGVHVAERRLRHLMDLPITEGVLLRPSDEPIEARILFDWDLSLAEALMQRAEIRRQKWVIKQRELELIAARNFLKPQLDVVGLYRWRGFGRSLLNPEGNPSEYFDVMPPPGPDDPNHDPRRFSDAFTNLTDGDFQEWQLGMELQFPIGSRRAHAGVRHAEFQLVHAQAVLKEQEHLIVRDLSNAFAEVDRAYGLLQTVTDRRFAAHAQLKSLQAAYREDQVTLNLVLDAQRRLATAESRYYEALVEHTLAVKGLQFEKGTLLEYEDIQLAEGPWSEAAHADARELLEHRKPARDSRFLPEHRVITTQ